MRSRPLIAAAVAAALAVPAVVLADGLGPHATWYATHKTVTKPENDISIVVHRDKGKADFFVTNFCLGTEQGQQGSSSFPNTASVRGAKVKHGKISFSGKGTIFTANGQQKVTEKFTATLKPKKATGTAKFRTVQKCNPIKFTAKLAGRTK
jgi:hypothetical protein